MLGGRAASPWIPSKAHHSFCAAAQSEPPAGQRPSWNPQLTRRPVSARDANPLGRRPVLGLKQVRLGIVMGGMHFAAGMPVRNLRTRLQNGFADAPLGRRPALAHRGMVFEPLFCWSKRHCVRAWRSPKTAGALRTCADRHHLPHSFPCRKEVLQPIIISQDPVDHSPGRAHDLAGQQHDGVQKAPKLHFD